MDGREAADFTEIVAGHADGALRVQFHPIVELQTGHVVAVEARGWLDDGSPATEWMGGAPTADLATQLELAAVEAALDRLDELPLGVLLAVNASPGTVVHPGFSRCVQRVPGPRVLLQLNEHPPVVECRRLLVALDELRSQGLRLAIDDAGTGLDGLQHLLGLSPDVVRLDVALVRGINHDPARRAVVAATSMFAQETGALVLAAGIETKSELAMLRALGISWGQGFHLVPPGPMPTA